MNLVELPPIINKGIAVFIPYEEYLGDSLLRVEFKYSKTNPSFTSIACTVDEQKLWDGSMYLSRPGALATYITSSDLSPGFYTITIVCPTKGLSSVSQYGVIRPTNKLIIGLPYSAYPPPQVR